MIAEICLFFPDGIVMALYFADDFIRKNPEKT